MRIANLMFILILASTTVWAQSRPIVSAPDSSSRPFGFQCVIDSLQTGESMYVVWHMSGCFASDEDSIWIGRTHTGFTVTHGTKKKTLTSAEADVIRDFEYELFKIGKMSGGCTTSEYYTFKRKNVSYMVCRDATCRHNFWHDLLTSLKL